MDIPSLLESLNAHDVTYLVIGALAFPHHGYARATLDLDVFIKATPENAGRTREALLAFGFDMSDVSIDDLCKLKILIRDYAVQFDTHPFVKGVEFQEAWNRREASSIGGVEVFVPCLDDVIRMKVAAGRPKDIEDLKYLQAIRARRGD
jgi:predicted nucleotidyltransferase